MQSHAAQSGAFGQTAFALCDAGLFPIPTSGDDGKRPAIKNYTRAPINLGNVQEFQLRFDFANIGLVCGPSRINVLDIDDPQLFRAMVKRFGDTPLIVRTGGRGGWQLFYRSHPNVSPIDFRSSEGIEVEIKARKNIVIVPPSVSPRTGRSYEFVEGDLAAETIRQLPVFREHAIIVGASKADREKIHQGRRNNWLFSQCLKVAKGVDSFDDLLDYAHTRNEEADPPLADGEVVSVARSAWRYTLDGKNFVGTSGSVVFTAEEVEELARRFPGDASVMLMKLMLAHGHRIERGEAFALSTPSMEKAGTLPGWTRPNLRTAIINLERVGLLEAVRRGRGSPVQYVAIPLLTKRPA